jgi:hypothetical protein
LKEEYDDIDVNVGYMTYAPTTIEEDVKANNIVVSDIIIAAASTDRPISSPLPPD